MGEPIALAQQQHKHSEYVYMQRKQTLQHSRYIIIGGRGLIKRALLHTTSVWCKFERTVVV